MLIFDGLTQPGMSAHIDLNRAMIGTNAALHATCLIGHNISLNPRYLAGIIQIQYPSEVHSPRL